MFYVLKNLFHKKHNVYVMFLPKPNPSASFILRSKCDVKYLGIVHHYLRVN